MTVFFGSVFFINLLMKITLTALLLITSCFFLSSTCKKEEEPFCPLIKINNLTDKPIYTIYSFDYPDTALNFQNPIINPNAKKLSAHYKGPVTDKYTCLGDKLTGQTTIQRVSLFVFDAAELESTPWSEVRQKYQVLKRFDLTLDDLLNNNYTFDLQ